MNMTNADFKAIEKALQLLPQGDDFKRLDAEAQETIRRADLVMANLYKKKQKTNQRTAQYIAKKREDNKNYARTPYVKKGEKT